MSDRPVSPYRKLQLRAKAAGLPANKSAKVLQELLGEGDQEGDSGDSSGWVVLNDGDSGSSSRASTASAGSASAGDDDYFGGQAVKAADAERLVAANAASATSNAEFFPAVGGSGDGGGGAPERRIELPFMTILLPRGNGNTGGSVGGGGSGTMVDWLRGYAAMWWYPWMVGLLSGFNNFAVVLSAPLVVLFLSGVYANPKMRVVAAFANAVGTTIGIALLIYLMQTQGVSYIETNFAKQLASPVAVRTQKYWDEYGIAGAVFISMMPIFLQPLVFIGVMAKTPMATLVTCVLVGRTIKYIIMAELAIVAPNLLKFFGSAAVDASNKIRNEEKRA